MTKPEWGLKRVCPSCGTRYYDMRKTPPTCPSCGALFDPEQVIKVRRRATTDDKNRKTAVATDEAADDIDDIETLADDAEGGAIEDAEELGDEDADLGEVVELDDDDKGDAEH